MRDSKVSELEGAQEEQDEDHSSQQLLQVIVLLCTSGLRSSEKCTLSTVCRVLQEENTRLKLMLADMVKRQREELATTTAQLESLGIVDEEAAAKSLDFGQSVRTLFVTGFVHLGSGDWSIVVGRTTKRMIFWLWCSGTRRMVRTMDSSWCASRRTRR